VKRVAILGLLLMFVFSLVDFTTQNVSADYEDVEDPIITNPYD